MEKKITKKAGFPSYQQDGLFHALLNCKILTQNLHKKGLEKSTLFTVEKSLRLCYDIQACFLPKSSFSVKNKGYRMKGEFSDAEQIYQQFETGIWRL